MVYQDLEQLQLFEIMNNKSILVSVDNFLCIPGIFYIVIDENNSSIFLQNMNRSIYYWFNKDNLIRLYTKEYITQSLLETIRIYRNVNVDNVHTENWNNWELSDFIFPVSLFDDLLQFLEEHTSIIKLDEEKPSDKLNVYGT